MKIITRNALKRMAWLLGIFGLLLFGAWWVMLRMPGKSYSGEPPPERTELIAELKRDIEKLCGDIGERNVYRPRSLDAARDWIEGELRKAGYDPKRQVYAVGPTECANIEVEIPGDDSIVVVGGHYDSVPGCPGANDNGTGTVATLALARRFAKATPKHTLRFVFFVNEEPPHFQTDAMGSLVYARRCRERDEDVVAMISLETLGYFTDEPDSQRYPVPVLKALYGSQGNYAAFVGNVGSGSLVRRALGVFRKHAKIPSEGIAMIGAVPGVGWSDHWSFWECDYPAIMVTDTAPFRYPHYHLSTDTPDQLNYDGLALVVEGLVPVIEDLMN